MVGSPKASDLGSGGVTNAGLRTYSRPTTTIQQRLAVADRLVASDMMMFGGGKKGAGGEMLWQCASVEQEQRWRQVGRRVPVQPGIGLNEVQGTGLILQNVETQHPPNKEQGDDGYNQVAGPLAGSFGFSSILHGDDSSSWGPPATCGGDRSPRASRA